MSEKSVMKDIRNFLSTDTGKFVVVIPIVLIMAVFAVNYILEGQISFNIPQASIGGIGGSDIDGYTALVDGQLMRFVPERIGDDIVWRMEEVGLAQASVGRVTQTGTGSWLLERLGQNVAGDPLSAPITLGSYRITILDITNTPNPYYNVVDDRNTLASGRPLCPMAIKVEGPDGTFTGTLSSGADTTIGGVTFDHQWTTLRTVPVTSTFPGAYEVVPGTYYARACKGTGYYQGLYGVRVSVPGQAQAETGALQEMNVYYVTTGSYVTVTAQAIGDTFLKNGGEWRILLDGAMKKTIPYDGSKTINQQITGIVSGTGMHTITVQITDSSKNTIDQRSMNFDTGGDNPPQTICSARTYSCGGDGNIYLCNSEGTSLDLYMRCPSGSSCGERSDGVLACISQTPLGCAWDNPSCAEGYDCINNKCVREQVEVPVGEVEEAQPVCGNQECEYGETSDNCPIDCPYQSVEDVYEQPYAVGDTGGFIGGTVEDSFADTGTGFAVSQPEPDNTLLFVGIGFVVVIGIGGYYYYTTQQKKPRVRRRR